MARVHYAWVVAGVTFVTLVAAAAFRAAPGPLMVPLQEAGWSLVTMSAAVSVNLVLYGLTAPFAAALMERFGLRRVVSVGLLLIAAGAGLSALAQTAWHLVLSWGVLIGLGTGSMALVFAATVANAWFVKRRGLVMGILTAGGAAGQLVFLPTVAHLVEATSWRIASLLIAAAAVVALPLVVVLLRDRPADLGLLPYGQRQGAAAPPEPKRGNAGHLAVSALHKAIRTKAFWALAGAFAICGATTNGLIGIHFIPSAHDHGMATTTAAGLLMVVGVFDIFGTVASGWFTDRIDPRWLLLVYYTFRGVGLLLLPWLLADTVHPSMVVFIVVYGLDWVATVPPTVALCRRLFGSQGTIVFGWVFASHQLGAATAALAAGIVRQAFGTYTYAWFGGAALCALAAVLSIAMRPRRDGPPAPSPPGTTSDRDLAAETFSDLTP